MEVFYCEAAAGILYIVQIDRFKMNFSPSKVGCSGRRHSEMRFPTDRLPGPATQEWGVRV